MQSIDVQWYHHTVSCCLNLTNAVTRQRLYLIISDVFIDFSLEYGCNMRNCIFPVPEAHIYTLPNRLI